MEVVRLYHYGPELSRQKYNPLCDIEMTMNRQAGIMIISFTELSLYKTIGQQLPVIEYEVH